LIHQAWGNYNYGPPEA